MGRISTPVRTAQRGRQPMVCASRFAEVRTHPLYKECTSPLACALTLAAGLTLPRPPHPAPQTVTIASRPSLSGTGWIGI